MPTYEYECKSCGHNFDVFQSMSEEALSDCPQCGKELRRLINGGGGVIFKGSGFYVNDKNRGNTKTASSKPGEKTAAPLAADKSGATGEAGEAKTACGSTASCPAAAACPAANGAAAHGAAPGKT